jgi:hypothetical protein
MTHLFPNQQLDSAKLEILPNPKGEYPLARRHSTDITELQDQLTPGHFSGGNDHLNRENGQQERFL